MAETIPRMSPYTGTEFPRDRPFWIVDGRAYDLTEWMGRHPGGAIWFAQTEGRDISALLHTYHRDPARLQKILAKYLIEELADQEVSARLVAPFRLGERDMRNKLPVPTEKDILPKLGVPPFLLPPEFNAPEDLPRLDYRDEGSLLAAIRQRVNAQFSKQALKKYDRAFDAVTWMVAAAHVAALALLVARVIPGWAFVVIMVVTRTALAGSGHYGLHRKWKPGHPALTLPLGKALFDLNYVGTSLLGPTGTCCCTILISVPGRMLRKRSSTDAPAASGTPYPGLHAPQTRHMPDRAPLRGREITKFERHKPVQQETGAPFVQDPIRADFWIIRAWIVFEFALCLATGHIVAWLVQFFLTLWINTFLVVASHDFEDPNSEEELAVIPEPLRDDWAASRSA